MKTISARTFETDGFLPLLSAVKTAVVLIAMFLVVGHTILFCLVTGAIICLAMDMDYNTAAQIKLFQQRQRLHQNVYTQFIQSCRELWRRIVALKHAEVDYHFRVSLAEVGMTKRLLQDVSKESTPLIKYHENKKEVISTNQTLPSAMKTKKKSKGDTRVVRLVIRPTICHTIEKSEVPLTPAEEITLMQDESDTILEESNAMLAESNAMLAELQELLELSNRLFGQSNLGLEQDYLQSPKQKIMQKSNSRNDLSFPILHEDIAYGSEEVVSNGLDFEYHQSEYVLNCLA